jgi:hypothetical protein
MRRLQAIAFALAIPATVMAQPAPQRGDPMTSPVTPRDVAWYLANPVVREQTLKVCHGNAAYSDTPDCQNAERAGAAAMHQRYARAASKEGSIYDDPAYWDANPAIRAGILAQCRRRGPGDELVFMYCKAASASALRSLNGTAPH